MASFRIRSRVATASFRTRDVVRQILSQSSLAGEDWPALKNRIKDELHRFIFEKIKRNPMILPIILDV